MPKVSIVALISGFFAFTLIVINIALYLEHERQVSDYQYYALQRFQMTMRLMHDHKSEDFMGQEIKLKVKISRFSEYLLKSKGKKILEDPFSYMILYKDRLFLVPKPPPKERPDKDHDLHEIHRKPPILEDLEKYSTNRIVFLIVLINTLMLIFFWIVLRKLLNLKNLKIAIMQLDEGHSFSPIELNSEDELGEIANEFNLAMEKIHLLKEARTFFLRNILHELKTPIMKGRLVSNSLDESAKREQLQHAFLRLESLLSEMVKIEKLSSNEWKLDKREYRLVDIIDHSIDLLMSDTSRIEIKGTADAPIINVDFELFSTALKNLLDNALKHSEKKVCLNITKTSIEVCSFGDKIEDNKLDFSKPFNRETEGSASGLGLGLYIVDSIARKHDMHLKYRHFDKQNCFVLAPLN